MKLRDLVQVTDVGAVDNDYLTWVLQQAGFPKARVQSFSRSSDVGPSFGGGGMLVRFSLDYGEDVPDAAPRSMVLKQARPHPWHANDAFGYRREAECYLQGLFDDLPGNLYVPRAYAAVVQEDVEQSWIWMEDMKGVFDVAWTMETLIEATADAAELHALWWQREEELAAMPFLMRRCQNMYHGGPFTQHLDQNFAAIEDHPKAGRIKRVFTPERQRLLRKLYSLATHICERLEKLPQTLLHQDFYPPNLGRAGEKTVLIDWALTGMGTPGSELSTTMWQPGDMIPGYPDSVGAGEKVQARLLETYRTSLQERGIDLNFADLLDGFQWTACLRPAHGLGGYVLPGLLLGRCPHGGARDFSDLGMLLLFSEMVFQLLEKAAARL